MINQDCTEVNLGQSFLTEHDKTVWLYVINHAELACTLRKSYNNRNVMN